MKKWTTSTRVAFPTPTTAAVAADPHPATATKRSADVLKGAGAAVEVGGVSLLRVLQVRRKPA